MSKRFYETYVARVAHILKQTGHPRQREVLDDLRAHLNEVANRDERPATIDELTELLGSPEEYAENLAPATGYSPRPWFRRPRTWVAATTLLIALTGGLAVLPDLHVVGAHLRNATDSNFVAPSPFFDLARARALSPGATGEEIRDALGYPWRRYRGTSDEERRARIRYPERRYADTAKPDEVVWEYTMSVDVNSPFYTVCNVIADSDERLLRVDTFRADVPFDDRRSVTPWMTRRWANHREAWFARLGRDELRLRSDDPFLYVIRTLLVRDDREIEPCLLEARQKTTEHWMDVPMDRVRFIYCAGPFALTDSELRTFRPRFEKKLEELPDDLLVYDSFAYGGPLSASTDAIDLYHRGVLYGYPPMQMGADERFAESVQRDQNWLIHRLLSM